MTYKILSDNGKILNRSELRTAESENDPNKFLAPLDGESYTPPNFIKSSKDKLLSGDDLSSDSEALSDIDGLVGRTFLLKIDDEGTIKRARVAQLVDKHEHDTNESPEHRKFIIKVGKEEYEDVMAYNKIIEHLEAESEEPVLWKFRRLISHEGPLKADDDKWKGCSYNVQVEWENGEVTNEPHNIIGADSPVVCAVYAKENNLLDTPGWKRFKRIANRQKKLL